ncbi:MAG: chromosome segregation protein SMC, partial [Steroidobacteraceae bacterium]
AFHDEQAERVSGVQGRYYEVGAEISRTEQTIQHTRELRERQRLDLAQARSSSAELRVHIERDEQQLAAARGEIAQLTPTLDTAQRTERQAASGLDAAERAVEDWQRRWEEFNRALGSADQTTQVERARIEQLENQLRRLGAQADRLALERDAIAAQEAGGELTSFSDRERTARLQAEGLAKSLAQSLATTQALRAEQLAVEARLESARAERERVRAELVALEALQQAALGRSEGRASEWIAAQGLDRRPRVATALDVETGWERAVETALGDYLEAICVTGLDELAGPLATFADGRVTLVEHVFASRTTPRPSLAGKVAGPRAIVEQLGRVLPAESLAEAFAQRARLEPGESLITREGEWVGRDWVRVNRGTDQHSGTIEREHRLKSLRTDSDAADERAREVEGRLASIRQSLTDAEGERDRAQRGIQAAHREHADLLAQLERLRARSQEATLRRERLEEEAAEVANETAVAQEALARARAELDRGLTDLGALDGRRSGLENEREELREAHGGARSRSQDAQAAARDLLIRIESRRSTESSTAVGLERMLEQRTQFERRCEELERELASGDAPITDLQARLEQCLARRLEVEAELSAARRALEDADAELRALDERRAGAEQRVSAAREAMEEARLAAQETRVRREAIAEQFAETHYELNEIRAALPTEAAVAEWDTRLAETRADIERLGQVNLAAIDELKEQSERKEYLDRQFTDLSEALNTLDQAMRRIDKETRTRFEETFERINSGLKEKFPRLFGGGHAYLELVGDDPLSAGVAVMARPPGKRNSTISQLSGGEKALTAVALVFSIFDLNPAPFCLLDEVDAPLDEHNVGRFCDIVRDMSGRVQFIFITHNKATMELASQLVGVTMNEPGVSRLVAVDVDEAVRLAAV